MRVCVHVCMHVCVCVSASASRLQPCRDTEVCVCQHRVRMSALTRRAGSRAGAGHSRVGSHAESPEPQSAQSRLHGPARQRRQNTTRCTAVSFSILLSEARALITKAGWIVHVQRFSFAGWGVRDLPACLEHCQPKVSSCHASGVCLFAHEQTPKPKVVGEQ